MRVFVTGATGWVGSAVVGQLYGAGHRVTGLSRSKDKGAALRASGADVLSGTLDDLDLLRDAARTADAVVHTAFNHDFSQFAENAEQDRRAIKALGAALEGSDKPLVVTSGLVGLASGRPATEADRPNPASPRKSEAAAGAVARRGVRVARVRLARSGYVGEGSNRWSGVHRSDAATLYRLVLERGAAEPVYHAAAEDKVPFRLIAGVIGRRLGVPVEPRPTGHFGRFVGFAGMDMASSEHTRAVLGWQLTGPDLLSDIDQPGYIESQLATRTRMRSRKEPTDVITTELPHE